MNIVFRCDGANMPEIGSGHVIRSLIIAKELSKRKFCNSSEIFFLSKYEAAYESGYKLLIQSGFNVSKLDVSIKNNSSEEQDIIRSLNPDLIILDRLETSSSFILPFVQSQIKVLTFDDLGTGRERSDLAVNAIFNLVPSANNTVTGYKYLVLSDLQYEAKVINKKVNTVTATFGGYDNRNILGFVIDNLEFILQEGNIVNLIVGESSDSKKDEILHKLENIPFRLRGRVHLHQRPKNFYDLLYNSDIALVSGGLTAFECARMGVPALGLPQYEHQLSTLKCLSDAGAILLGSDNMQLKPAVFFDQIRMLSSSYKLRRKISENAVKLIDGMGLSRVINLIISKFKQQGMV